MPTHTSLMQTQTAPREERIRHFVPAPPGSFVVFYNVQTRELAKHPIVGWGVREREEWRFRDGEPDDHVLCDYVEAMVAARGLAETVFASDLYDPDGQGNELYRTLGITWSGDTTNWAKEMERDLGLYESIQSSRIPPPPPMRAKIRNKRRRSAKKAASPASSRVRNAKSSGHRTNKG